MNSTAGQVISCSAAICWSAFNQTIETIEVSPPKAGEVRVKVIACGICGSDDHILRADELRASTVKWPTILGHEAGGVVESVGDGVTSVKSGDHVLAVWMPQCDDCELCRGTDTNFCMKGTQDAVVEKWTMRDNTSRLSHAGQPVYKYLNIGAFAEYIVMPEEQVIKIPNDVPIEEFCLFACGFTTGYGSSVNVAKIKSNHSVAIWGLGTVGLAAVMGAKDMSAKEIIGVDTNEDKFELAMKLGCTQTINPLKLSKPINEIFQEKFSGLNVGIDCVGNIKVIETIMSSIKPWGTVCMVGIPPFKPMQIYPIQFIRGRILTGADFGGFKGKNAINYFLDKYKNGKISVKDFITETITLNEINRGFEMLKNGNAIKIIVKIS